MSKKSIFICYSGHEQDSVSKFKQILDSSMKNAGIYDKIIITDMHDIPDGESRLTYNEIQIKKADIFLLMISPKFIESDPTMKNEIPAVIDFIDQGKKKCFFIRLTDASYTDNVFLRNRQFFRSARAQNLKYFDEDIGSQTGSQRQAFVEDLVEKIAPLVKGQSADVIRDIRDLPHLVDFTNEYNSRDLRVCKINDKLMIAEYLMTILFPPLRHLPVVNDEGELTGIISIRDILRFGFKNKMKRDENLSLIDPKAIDELVSAHCISKDDMIYLTLAKENKIEDVIQNFICSSNGKPIGIIPVTRKEGDFSKGNFEVVSYIDILKNWEKLPGANELKTKKAVDFKKQETIETVRDDDAIVVAYQILKKGIRSIPVVDSKNEYIGIIADTELLGGMKQTEKVLEKIHSILRNRKIKIDAKNNFSQIVDFFIKNRNFTSFPVLDQYGKIEKMIGHTDVLKMIQESIINNNRQ
ncbi:MAG: CBS domain-containing protein [Treponema sp.]|nr:CBS domain-containing protein [Treponema sp.]